MNTPIKRCELDIVLSLLSKDFTKAQIRKKLDIKASTLSNRLRRLENLGYIERQGKYLIKVIKKGSPSSHIHPRVTKNEVHMKLNKKLNKRGHAFNFKIHFPKEKDLLKKPKVKHELKVKNLKSLKFGSLKLIKDKCSIWINKTSLTIYSNNSYYSDDALHSKFRALKDIDNLVIYLKDRFGFSGIYGIEVFREHYGLIFNKFAQWILKNNRKLYVKELGNKTILWVDNSRKDDKGLEEFETNDPIRANNSDSYFNSHEKTGWKNDAHVVEGNKKEIANLKGVFPVMEEYNKNLKLHISVQEEQLETQKQTQLILKKLENKIT